MSARIAKSVTFSEKCTVHRMLTHHEYDRKTAGYSNTGATCGFGANGSVSTGFGYGGLAFTPSGSITSHSNIGFLTAPTTGVAAFNSVSTTHGFASTGGITHGFTSGASTHGFTTGSSTYGFATGSSGFSTGDFGARSAGAFGQATTVGGSR